MYELLACEWVSLFTPAVHNTAQSSSDYIPSYPPDKHRAQMQSIGGDGDYI